MTSACTSSLPGFFCSLLCCLPSIIYPLVMKDYLPEKCATHFNAYAIPDGWMSKKSMVMFTIFFPLGMTLFMDLMSLLILPCPLSAMNGINKEYYSKGKRFDRLKAMIANMMYVISALTGLFMFSILEPTWEYNMRCEITIGTPMPCDYKIHFLPQTIIYLVLMTAVIIAFSMDMNVKPESLVEEDNWKCGAIYVNADDERVCVPKRLGIGTTINLGHACGIMTCVAIIFLPLLIGALFILFL